MQNDSKNNNLIALDKRDFVIAYLQELVGKEYLLTASKRMQELFVDIRSNLNYSKNTRGQPNRQ